MYPFLHLPQCCNIHLTAMCHACLCTNTPISKVHCITSVFAVAVQRWTFTIRSPNFLFNDFYFRCFDPKYFCWSTKMRPTILNLSHNGAKYKIKKVKRECFGHKFRQWERFQAKEQRTFTDDYGRGNNTIFWFFVWLSDFIGYIMVSE